LIPPVKYAEHVASDPLFWVELAVGPLFSLGLSYGPFSYGVGVGYNFKGGGLHLGFSWMTLGKEAISGSGFGQATFGMQTPVPALNFERPLFAQPVRYVQPGAAEGEQPFFDQQIPEVSGSSYLDPNVFAQTAAMSAAMIPTGAPTALFGPGLYKALVGPETKAEWQQFLLDKLGVTKDDVAGYDRFTPHNQDVMKKFYGYYESIYKQNPDLLWAGMAKLAGNVVYDGLRQTASLRNTFAGPGIELAASGVERELMQMNLEIFMDLGWQHEAYMAKGIAGIRAAGETGQNLRAWEYIDAGIDAGIPGAIAKGNEMLLYREQSLIVRRGYAALQSQNMTKIMSALTISPIPGVKPFAEAVPGGNIANFADRWKWIQNDMWPAFRDMNEGVRARLISLPLGNIRDVPMVYQYETLRQFLERPNQQKKP
jgi:hypothetical protein